MPRNTPAFHIVTLLGGPTSSAGVPNTRMRPGRRRSRMSSMTAMAVANPTGLCALCWHPWKASFVPRSASYSTMMPNVGPFVPAGESQFPTNAVSSPAWPVVTANPAARSTRVRVSTDLNSLKPTSGFFPMWSLRDRNCVVQSCSTRSRRRSRSAPPADMSR